MASELQDSLLKAIDYLVNNRVQKINKDTTVTCTVKECTNALENQYQMNYNGGFFYAYAQEGATYSANTSVYVLVPENDWSKRKLIIGKASSVTDDDNITFVSSVINDYNMIGSNVIEDEDSSYPLGLHSYLSSEYLLLYQRGDEEHSILSVDESALTTYVKDAEALLIEASFMTRLPKAHRLAKNGVYGVQFVLAFQNQEDPSKVKYVSYTLDSNQMTGNPLLYNSYSDQYAIFPIDAKNFLYVDSIMIWEEGFVEQSDSVQADFWGADILIKDLEIYGLRAITATNGDYILRISTPQGALFHSFEQTDSLSALGSVSYQINTNVSDSTSYYWFVKDDRIDATSEEYNIYGGSGWRYLKDKGNNRTLTTTGYENRAYENIYLLAAVYKEQVILKEQFVFYNEAASRNIKIESNLGTTFAFDRGTPTLTCMIDGKSSEFDTDYPDEYFSFSWSKIDIYGNTTSLNTSYEDLEKQYNAAVEAGESYSTIAAIRNNMIAMEGVVFDRNVLTYPINQIDSVATFSCSVYLRETSTAEDFFIGSANITLQNENVASPTDYYILIENGDQVLQYSESGVAPTSERYQDPQEVLPLECHFYDPAGLEVNPDTYTVKWKIPLESTLITTPTEGMVENPATELKEWYTQAVYPLAIEDSYDYQATTNQVTCIVEYNGVEYQRDSNLFFTKIGENGTNGTDVVCKISPTREPEKGLLAIELRVGQDPIWNTGQGLGVQALEFKGYNRTELLNLSSVYWNISGGNDNQSRYMSIDSDTGVISWADKGTGHRNQIVRGQVSFEGQTYYAFYPIPVIEYNTGTEYKVIIDKTYTLKSITYNSDGRNPLYNKNQGLVFSLSDGSTTKPVEFDVFGGLQDNVSTSAISISLAKDDMSAAKSVMVTGADEDGFYRVYIKPDDIYDGAWCNNIVRARIYGSQEEVGQNPEAVIYMPIYMSLNTFGLASLNAWDGNHVEINEDENYILAPQIGAGYKDNNNRFTGVVMGTAQTYDQTEPSVGLLGYSEGKQSIFLDAETGNATFGLPEDQASTNNQYTEGRIELVPGGESKIGMWTIGSRAMYNITKPPTPIGEDEEGNIEFEDEYVGVAPDKPYRDYPVPDAQISVPPEAQGLILNANPAYISVKGMPLNDDNSNIDWEGANTTIKRGDSIEVELDPRKSSVFSIYRHTTWEGAEDTGEWRRYPMVGINANGQFYTNAIEDGESSMGIGRIGAFGTSAADDQWVGAQFAYQGSNIFKFFVPNDDTPAATRPVYITAGTTMTNEYPRSLNLYGKTVNLYSDERNNIRPSSEHWLSMANDVSSFGHTDNYIQIPSDSGANDYDFEIRSNASKATMAFTGNSLNIENSNALNLISKSVVGIIGSSSVNDTAVSLNITGNVDVRNFNELNLSSYAFSSTAKNYALTIKSSVSTNASGTSVNTAQMKLGNGNTWLELNDSTVSKLYGKLGMNIESQTGPVIIKSNKSSGGVQIDAYPADGSSTAGRPYLHLTPQTGGTGDFVLSSGHGTVRSMSDVGNGKTGVQITAGISTGWGYFSGSTSGGSAGDGRTYSIAAMKNVVTLQDYYGVDFNFNDSKSWTAHGNTYSSASIRQHLQYLYSLVNNAYNRADSAYDRAKSYYDTHIGGSLSGYATRSWVDSNYVTGSRNDFVMRAVYDLHSHRFTYTKNNVGYVTSISTYGGANSVVTDMP